jgi:hypothetical protein
MAALKPTVAVCVNHGGHEAGRKLLAWQSYGVRDSVADGDLVVVRMRWTGELAVDAGPWSRGTLLSAWCVAHYRLRGGRIVEIEQHDCYDAPRPPGDENHAGPEGVV